MSITAKRGGGASQAQNLLERLTHTPLPEEDNPVELSGQRWSQRESEKDTW